MIGSLRCIRTEIPWATLHPQIGLGRSGTCPRGAGPRPAIKTISLLHKTLQQLPLRTKPKRVDKTIRKCDSIAEIDEIKMEEYRYWQSRPVHERVAAVSELTQSAVGHEGLPG